MLDLVAFLERFGLAAVAIGVLAYLLWRYVVDPQIDRFHRDHKTVVESVKDVRDAFQDPNNKDKTILIYEVYREIEEVHDLIEKRCGNMACPAVKLVEAFTKSAYDKLDERLEKAEEAVIKAETEAKRYRDEKWAYIDQSLKEFRDEAKVSREETQKLIKQIFDRVYEFTERTGLALIETIQKRVDENGVKERRKGASDVN